MSNALAHLINLADQRKAQRSPNFPAKFIPRSKYSDKDANALTKCIVDFCNLSGHFATRLQSTGTYRADLQRFIPSQQRAGLPDVLACINGQFVGIEIKIGRDTLSQEQNEAIRDLQQAGARVFVANTFTGFYDWFTAQFPTSSTH
ncbi:VRR-NUC domain-containing protein [Nostoc sp. CHAB 5834]|nr:VRR-NUC domain-containing protein [Nostoc sp. CHAB 5834]